MHKILGHSEKVNQWHLWMHKILGHSEKVNQRHLWMHKILGHWEKGSLRESQPSKLAVGSQIVSHILRMWRLIIIDRDLFVSLSTITCRCLTRTSKRVENYIFLVCWYWIAELFVNYFLFTHIHVKVVPCFIYVCLFRWYRFLFHDQIHLEWHKTSKCWLFRCGEFKATRSCQTGHLPITCATQEILHTFTIKKKFFATSSQDN